MNGILRKIYIDRDFINDMYNQLFSEFTTEITTNSNSSIGTKGSAGLSSTGIISALFQTKGEIEGNLNKGKNTTRVIKTNEEQRIKEIESKIKKDKELRKYYFNDFYEAAKKIEIGVNAFVSASGLFSSTWYAESNKSQSKIDIVQFEIGADGIYDSKDDYYKRFGIKIKMLMGKKNCLFPLDSKTSHEAAYFRVFNGINIPLTVIGQLSKAGNIYFIKPMIVYR